MNKMKPWLFFVVTLIFSSCTNSIYLFIPNEFKGEILIIENKKKYDSYDVKAYENFRDEVYDIGDDNILYVKNIKPFMQLTDLTFSYAWVEPVPKETISLEIINKETIKLTFH